MMLAGVAWLLGYVFFKRRWFHRKIVTSFPKSGEVRREIVYSLRTSPERLLRPQAPAFL